MRKSSGTRHLVVSLLIAMAVALSYAVFTAQADQTPDVTIDTTGDFGPDPAAQGAFNRYLMMTGSSTAQQVVRPLSAKALQGEVLQTPVVSGTVAISSTLSGTVATAQTVTKGQTNLLICVTGTYSSTAAVTGTVTGGGSKNTWTTNYNRGEARILLEVNQPGKADNVILPVAKGATLTVTLVNAMTGTHSVYLSQSGGGTMTFSTNPVTFNGGGSKTIDLAGATTGTVTLTGTCTGLLTGTVDATVSSLALAEVTFGALTGTIHAVAQDADGDAYPTPHWKRSRAAQSPTCYEQASKMKVTLKLSAAAGFTGSVMVRGSGNGFSFSGTEASVSSGTVTISNWAADKAFASTIDLLDPLELSWEVSLDSGASWVSAGKSANPAYVVWDSPFSGASIDGGELLHTVVHVSCEAGKGIALDTAAHQKAFVNKVFERFATTTMTNHDGTIRLVYWSGINNPVYTVRELLTGANAACGAWGPFFRDCIDVQGLSALCDDYGLTPDRKEGFAASGDFLVKSWNMNVTPPTLIKSIRGQGGIPARANFEDHYVIWVYVCDKLFDPSYGHAYGSEQEWAKDSLSGIQYFEDEAKTKPGYDKNTGAKWDPKIWKSLMN